MQNQKNAVKIYRRRIEDARKAREEEKQMREFYVAGPSDTFESWDSEDDNGKKKRIMALILLSSLVTFQRWERLIVPYLDTQFDIKSWNGKRA